jgi:hypothetical protein
MRSPKAPVIFLLISTQLIFSQQEENKNEISIDTLEEKLLLDKVRRKAKGFIRINNKEKKYSFLIKQNFIIKI